MLTIDQLKSGDTFFECEDGFNDEYTAVGDPYRIDNGWAIQAWSEEDETPTEFFCRDGFTGPKLYWQQEYI